MVRSPGRVNLIGDHTDYNDGFVMPFAIDRHIDIAASARSDAKVVARSQSVAEVVTVDLSGFSRGGDGWGEYLKGVLHFSEYEGPGLDILIDSNLPSGGGLSSSAALELGIARVISSVAGKPWDPVQAALLCQRAENEWVGTACGIMDQLVVACASADDVLEIDCRTLHFVPRRLPDEAVVVVLDTRTRRRLVSSAYRDRRQACDRAAAAYGVPALRDVTPHDVETRPDTLSPEDWARARHVVAENGRVRDAADALESGDLAAVGRLMVASHRSLRDLFSVSTPELDLMVELATSQRGLLGGQDDRCRIRWVCRRPVRGRRRRRRHHRDRHRVPGAHRCRTGLLRLPPFRRCRRGGRRRSGRLSHPNRSGVGCPDATMVSTPASARAVSSSGGASSSVIRTSIRSGGAVTHTLSLPNLV